MSDKYLREWTEQMEVRERERQTMKKVNDNSKKRKRS
jgi:hypothetical protein